MSAINLMYVMNLHLLGKEKTKVQARELLSAALRH